MKAVNTNKQFHEIKIEEEMNGSRIDMVLSFALPKTSRNFIQKRIDAGDVIVDGNCCNSKKYKVKTGEMVKIIIPEPIALDIKAEDIPLTIVYEDDDLLVVDKPSGMVVHPAAGNYEGTLVNAIMHHCGSSLSSINGVIRPGIVHRIDKDTSGLLMIAKNDATHNGLSEQLAEHSITRLYDAIVYNNFTQDEGTIKASLGRDPKNRLKRAVVKQGGKEAITHYKVLERFGKFTHIQAQLETGRTHQIRAHMAYIKHPLLGDTLYGPQKQPFKVEGQLLHASVLGFTHPRTKEYIEFKSPLPDEFQAILDCLAVDFTKS